MKYYKQCTFKSGNARTVAWIPEHGAKIGLSMVFKDVDDHKRWTVVSVGSRIEESFAKRQEQAWKHQHKMSDIPRRRGRNKED